MSCHLAGLVAPVLFESPTKTSYVLARAADYLGTALFLGGCSLDRKSVV